METPTPGGEGPVRERWKIWVAEARGHKVHWGGDGYSYKQFFITEPLNDYKICSENTLITPPPPPTTTQAKNRRGPQRILSIPGSERGGRGEEPVDAGIPTEYQGNTILLHREFLYIPGPGNIPLIVLEKHLK